MKANRLVLASALLALTTACVSERRPAPTPSPSASPPAPVATATPTDLTGSPLTPGDWSYRNEGVTTAALFGPAGSEPLLALRCNRSGRTISISRSGSAQQALPLTVNTSNAARTLSATPTIGQMPYLAATVPASDPLLDAMAFSRGRFSVAVPGLPTLVLPAWAEIGRVIEDCR